eukprot:GGOE01046749.1.p1 GENE.GGOE01046749.1~~GGOE01046749.1.p1  ORF type:complete len:542 (+),score=180.60 GGOE01046749.1:48-1628(+)
MCDVSLVATPSRPHLLLGQPQSLVVMLDLETAPVNRRAPFEMCIVLDRSNSMKGPALRDAKAAILRVIDALSPGDVLHLVAYDGDASVIFQNGDLGKREALHQQVTAIQSGGATNIGAALELAGGLLQAGRQGRHRRILLYSDGRPNVGLRSAEELGSIVRRWRMFYGIVTSAYGIGDSFQEEVMMEIAAKGGGRYAFVDEALIGRTMEYAMTELFTTRGTGARLMLEGLNGSVVKAVLGYDSSHLEEGLDCGEVHSGNRRKFLVALEVGWQAAGEALSTAGEQAVMSFSLEYIPVLSDTEDEEGVLFARSLSDSFGQKPVVLNGIATVKFTESMELAAYLNPRVGLALCLHEVAGAVEDVACALAQENVVKATDTLLRCSTKLQQQLPHDEDHMAEVMLGRVQRMLTRLESESSDPDFSKEIRKLHHYAKISRRSSLDEYKQDYSPSHEVRKRHHRALFMELPASLSGLCTPAEADVPFCANAPQLSKLVLEGRRHRSRRHSNPPSVDGSSETESIDGSTASADF